MSSQPFGGGRFINGRIVKKEGINWCLTDLKHDAQPANIKILIAFVSFDGSPMKITFNTDQGVNLEKVVHEFINHNHKHPIALIIVNQD